MGIEQTLDKLPVWNHKMAEWLEPADRWINVLLIIIAVLCVVAIFKLAPHYKALLAAYLLSP